ncbi:glucosaminidase domain-containing protein [Exiguobacterium sp. MMG028]|jgi:N-acetylmuramoyl-L-alanine amidase|uniref:glucosaminidase domain-containing protein n=1 Tax=unclassified Exiguobacterium TaxID=2644629 RepID=UPI001BE63D3D|nr:MULTISPECIES: glucosaminidase domain-containing protein [unclassified Exiguobacterium]MDA5561731.1 glucosaminidase domain-containing protein [Exiguobacterium sp. MMG028]MDE0563880.1 glucosaminidase domain-containing protein [Exiguobacterium sp. B2(2022)]
MKKVFGFIIVVLLVTSSFVSTGSIVEAAPKKQNRAIMGVSALTPQQMADYVKQKNPRDVRLAKTSVEDLAKLFVIIGAKEGVRGDVAFAQALKETGYFRYGGDVLPKQHNYSGIGTTGNGVKGHFFRSPHQGVTAQIQHLKAYASKDALNMTKVDPRFHLVKRGSATTWPSLHRKWAMQPKGNYGNEILSIYQEMSKTPKRVAKAKR